MDKSKVLQVLKPRKYYMWYPRMAIEESEGVTWRLPWLGKKGGLVSG